MKLLTSANILAALIFLVAIAYTASQMLAPDAKQANSVSTPKSVPNAKALPDFSTYQDVKAKKAAFFWLYAATCPSQKYSYPSPKTTTIGAIGTGRQRTFSR